MKAVQVGVGFLLMTCVPALAGARQIPGPPTTAAAEVTQCAQAQMVVDQLLAAAMQRLDSARQSNAAAELRAAVDSVQNTMRDARAQFAPCATAFAKARTDPHAGHNLPTAPSPAVQAPTMTKPSAPAPMDHSKMPMGVAPPAKTPAAKPGSSAKPPAPMDHPKMPMGTPPAKPAPAKDGKAEPSAAHADHSKMPVPASGAEASQQVDPVCGLKVDPNTSPQAVHQGKTHYFCSEQHRQLFQKNPSKYLPKGK
jgi:YHS domain-containing protein